MVPEAELRQLLQLKPGDVFSREKLQRTAKDISDRLGAEGLRVRQRQRGSRDRPANKRRGFTFFVDPGRRVYVRRINITGNARTRTR